ncbi:hypothetical protein PtrEW13061_011354 [Pyrenophora tritici-repentis]|nr:hypothetical protein PtrEW13061_011354 [Pyrenophora tritici-repentis]
MHRHGLSTRSLITLDAKPLAQRDTQLIVSNVERMTDEQVAAAVTASKSCTVGRAQLPLYPGVPNPSYDTGSQQLNIFPIPESIPNKLTLRNYCSYEVFYVYEIPGASAETGCLSAGGTVPVDLVSTVDPIGPVFKMSKESNLSKSVNVEYSSGSFGMYNLSLISCLSVVDGKPDADTSACVGFEAGLQLSQPGGMAFQCAANTWCDDQAYFYGENLCKGQNPLHMLDQSKGLTMELCVGNKT